jgi:thiol-disulfide isomerase/thioredoxin
MLEGTLDWTVQTLDGKTVTLGNKMKDQVVFLNFWATWCPPCVAETPSIEKLYRKIGDRVAFACISNESFDTLLEFRKKSGYTFPMYRRSQGPPSEFNTGGIPATFILSKNRKILLKHVGGADWAHESVVAFLEEVLTAEPEQIAGQTETAKTAFR